MHCSRAHAAHVHAEIDERSMRCGSAIRKERENEMKRTWFGRSSSFCDLARGGHCSTDRDGSFVGNTARRFENGFFVEAAVGKQLRRWASVLGGHGEQVDG